MKNPFRRRPRPVGPDRRPVYSPSAEKPMPPPQTYEAWELINHLNRRSRPPAPNPIPPPPPPEEQPSPTPNRRRRRSSRPFPRRSNRPRRPASP